MLRHLATLAATTLLPLAIAGCGGASDNDYRFPVHRTEGKVTYKGAPVAKAVVRFHPETPDLLKMPEGKTGPAVMLTTETTPEGAFTMSTYLGDDGIPAGDYIVTVAQGPDPESDVENSDGKTPPARKAVGPPRRYRDAASSPLRAKVKDGENRFEFNLE